MKQYSFEKEPAPIPESEITCVPGGRLVVVGEGFAGLCCALAAAEAGTDTVILTASSGPVGRGGSVFAAYSKVMAEHGFPRMDLDAFVQQELEANTFLVDQRKWYRLIYKSEEAMDWLVDKIRAAGYEAVLEDANDDDPDSPTYQPPGTVAFVANGMNRAGIGMNLALRVLEDEFLAAGGRVIRNSPACRLEKKDGRVCAVIAKAPEGGYLRVPASEAVVLATGDFSANREMLEKYCPLYADGYTADGADYNKGFSWGGLFRGEGHMMALWAGAAWQKTWPCAPMIQGSRVCTNMPYGSHRGLRLNARGERFCNEDMNAAYTALNAIREKSGPFIIWGANYARDIRWRAHGGRRDGPDTPPETVAAGWDELVEKGKMVRADTIEGVVEQLGLPKETALREIERYNAMCRAGRDEDFHKKPKYLQEIRQAPFYGASLSDRIYFSVMGGPRTDWRMRICDGDDEPIPGLYCLGSMVGDMYANCYNFRIPGQNYGACLTFGYLTGRFIAGENN